MTASKSASNTAEVLNTIEIFSKYANQYQDKFMSYTPYIESYDILSALLSNPRAKVLDIACGPANISHYLLTAHPKLTIHGNDLSPEMLQLARQNIPKGKFELLDSRDIGTIKEHYDLLICGFLLPYLSPEEVQRFLTDAAGLLTSGGLVYLSSMIENPHKSAQQTVGAEAQSASQAKESSEPKERLHTYNHKKQHLLTCLVNLGFTIHKHYTRDYPEDDGSTSTDLFIFAELENPCLSPRC